MRRKIVLLSTVIVISAALIIALIFLAGNKATDESDHGRSASEAATQAQENDKYTNHPADTAEPKENNIEPDAGNTNYPIEITDSKGRIIKLDNEPERIISIGPDITEIIFALGKGNKLVGRSAFCDYPPEALDIPAVGDFYEWNLETIVSLEPDILFVSAMNTEENEKKLMDLGINTIFINQTESFEGVYATIGLIGKVLNAESESTEIINRMKNDVEKAMGAVKGLDRPSVYYVVGFGEYGDYTATGETFIAKMIDMAGGANIAADITGWIYSLEKLMEQDPDIIIGSDEAVKYFQETSGYKELTAVKEGRIYAINPDLLEIQGPRLSDGLLELVKIMHPGTIQ
ncbi:MAG TPA: ABC transporter substrate-binding protein [Ruminiclostridium sp.]|jgi:iron complex transport system substrate-binding protein|nr:ABC transporter substrate-binding protein [Clostridiaceae bacterium]HAA25798.1 ABC transporter substrate-binding protein [Ruminiclostridium sp.]